VSRTAASTIKTVDPKTAPGSAKSKVTSDNELYENVRVGIV